MENLNLIRKMAWNFWDKENNLEYDELFQEAALAYCKAADSFDPDNGAKLTTYAWWCMKNHLINYVKKMYKKDNSTKYIENDPKDQFRTSVHDTTGLEFLQTRRDERLMEYGLVSEPSETIDEKMEDWSEDCRTAAQMVLQEPEKYTGETPNFKRKEGTPKQRVKDALRGKGWTHKRVQGTINEMRQTVKAL